MGSLSLLIDILACSFASVDFLGGCPTAYRADEVPIDRLCSMNGLPAINEIGHGGDCLDEGCFWALYQCLSDVIMSCQCYRVMTVCFCGDDHCLPGQRISLWWFLCLCDVCPRLLKSDTVAVTRCGVVWEFPKVSTDVIMHWQFFRVMRVLPVESHVSLKSNLISSFNSLLKVNELSVRYCMNVWDLDIWTYEHDVIIVSDRWQFSANILFGPKVIKYIDIRYVQHTILYRAFIISLWSNFTLVTWFLIFNHWLYW